jgi:response regulator RpfG family c-di-GMP phosphodiesterase
MKASDSYHPKGAILAILIVDDDEMNREILSEYLALEGYEVVTAHNGKKALHLSQQQPPRLILMDVSIMRPCAIFPLSSSPVLTARPTASRPPKPAQWPF